MTTLSMMIIGNRHVSNYQFPSVELLEKRNAGKEEMSIAESAENDNKLKRALEQFGVKVDRVESIIGSAIAGDNGMLLPGYRFSQIKKS